MTEEQFVQLLESNGMGKYRSDILGLTRNGIFVTPQRVRDENEIPIGHTKMGGNPDLPANFAWPKFENLPLTFIAQFKLSDCAAYDTNHELPTNGLLYFFYEALGEPEGSYEQREAHHVLFVPDETALLMRHPHPKHKTERKYGQIEALPACTVTIKNGVTIPHYNQARTQLSTIWDAGEEDKCWDKMYEWDIHRNHHLLGMPNEIQNDMTIDCVLGSKNLEWRMSSTPEVIEAAKEWQLLFQLDDDTELNVEWGDSGMVYFWIRKPDLQNRIFDKTWAIMQSC